jgi:hypothetical protein
MRNDFTRGWVDRGKRASFDGITKFSIDVQLSLHLFDRGTVADEGNE